MKELRNSVLLLLAYIIGLLGIAQIQYLETNYINFEEAFFIMFAVVAMTGVLLPSFFRPSIYLNLLIWGIIYVFIWLFHWRFLDESPTTLVLGLQFILIELAAGLSHFVGLHLDEVEFLLDGLSTSTYPNRMLNLNDARERINTEIMRSSRFNHPLTVLVVQMKTVSEKETWSTLKNLQRDLLKRFAVAKAGQIIGNLARQTDLIVQENNERFVVVCPETDKERSAILAERICKVVENELEGDMAWGCASFPEESFSFEELLELALKRIGNIDATISHDQNIAGSKQNTLSS